MSTTSTYPQSGPSVTLEWAKQLIDRDDTGILHLVTTSGHQFLAKIPNSAEVLKDPSITPQVELIALIRE